MCLSLYQRKITAVVEAYPAWEAGTDGMFSKATLSNLDALDKEQGRAGHSHCLSGLTLLFLWFIASLGCSSSDPASAAGCHTCILRRVSMNPLALLGSWKLFSLAELLIQDL